MLYPVRLVLFLSLFMPAACGKNEKPLSAEEQLSQQRLADAAFNSNITPGVGNVLFESNLVPNAQHQLVFKISYNGDTLAGYGKINAAGKLQYLTATALAKKGNTEVLVTEMFPEVSKSRMYTILNGKKSSIVVEMNHLAANRVSMSTIDLDWTTGQSTVINQSYYTDGKEMAGFTALRETGEGGDRVYNCAEPQPSDDVNKSVDNTLDYFQCGGHAYDTYPALAAIKAAIMKSIEAVKNAAKYQSKQEEVKSMERNYSALNELFKSISGKISGYKFEKSILAGYLRDLAAEINELKAQLRPDVLLVPFAEASDLDYDEVTDEEVKLTFTLIDQETRLPYTKKPIGIDMAFMVPGTNEAVYMETKFTSTVNGLVTFKVDPTTIPDHELYKNLTARYAFTQDNWSKSETRSLSFQYIKPKLVMKTGAAVPNSTSWESGEKRSFKWVNEDGRDISVSAGDYTLNNSNTKVQYTLLKGGSDFDLTLKHDEPTDQYTSLEFVYKGKKVQTVSTGVTPPCPDAPVITGVTLGCDPKGIVIKVAFTAKGSGILASGGSGGCDMAQTCYPVRLYFMNPGAPQFEIAANGYSVYLISGTVNEGVVGIYIAGCLSGKGPRESLEASYPNYRWQVQLMNKCNKRSSLVDL